MYKEEMQNLLIAVLILLIIIGIVGAAILVNSSMLKVEMNEMMIISAFSHSSEMFWLFFMSNLMRSTQLFVAGIIMVLLSIAFSIFSISYYKYQLKHGNYQETPPKKRKPALLYTIRPEKRIIISECPACHAPLKSRPPCECEYCGAILKLLDR